MSHIEEFKQLSENFIKLLEVVEFEADDMIQRQHMLEDLDRRVHAKEAEIAETEKDYKEKIKLMIEQMEHTKRLNLEQNKREEFIKTRTGEIEKENLHIITRQEELDTKEKEIKELLKKGDELTAKENDLKQRESIITKEKLLDAQRKQILDSREKRIGQEEIRLQQLSDRLK